MNGYEKGLAIRKQVLGPDYVEKTLQQAGGMFQPFQELLTEFAWGKVWTRGGLSLKTRSLLTVAMCIALNRPNEIKLHLRGAVRNGVSDEEITELVLHAFIYCGGPACVDAMNVIRSALPEIREMEGSGSGPPKRNGKQLGVPAAKKARISGAKAAPAKKERSSGAKA
jgi:4-carboxymuconolactone decarboxylase